MAKWILDRLIATTEHSDPYFAFQGTINWMHALSILVNTSCFDEMSLRTKYQMVMRRNPINIDSDTCAYESILKALHNLSALNVFSNTLNKYDIVRSAIISWYYCIYFSSQAMIFATSDARPETHSKTDKVWHSDVVIKDLAVEPFNLYLKEIVSKTVDLEIATLRNGNTFNLNDYPTSAKMALGCVCAYLNGTARYEREDVEERVRCSKEFKALVVNNFRTKEARALRDAQLERHHVNFLTQAFRYRGKANYRDSIYLSYGDDNTQKIDQLIIDLENVAEKFLKMVIFYVNRRVENGTWDLFVADVTGNARMNINVGLLQC